MSSAALIQRHAGLLLHVSSLPGRGPTGTLGADARRFVDFLAAGGYRCWQLLPISPTHSEGSPYNANSTFAGNPQFIDIDDLINRAWCGGEIVADGDPEHTLNWEVVYSRFTQRADSATQQTFTAFKQQHQYWLHDFARFCVLKAVNGECSWLNWPQDLKLRRGEALRQLDQTHTTAIESIKLQQFVFFSQWQTLKAYANSKGVALFGDLPIFVALDSADCWALPELFCLDRDRNPTHVAGVPPDYFSATGQRWGNPCYDWAAHQHSNFAWWLRRFHHHFALFDRVRVDHFRGFAAYWEIPASAATAIDGNWQPAPGRELFACLQQEFGVTAIVAEDLGIITDDVVALRRDFQFPGMKILQFAFDGGAKNPYLPHNHQPDSVVYTGTHDNNTTVGWWRELTADGKASVIDYLGHPSEAMPWPLLRAALASVADTAILPLQDVLSLDATARMNTPGTVAGNWRFRFTWEQVPAALPKQLRHLNAMYGRC